LSDLASLFPYVAPLNHKSQKLVANGKEMVHDSDQIDAQAEGFCKDEQRDERTPVEDHETEVEKKGVKREYEAVGSLLPLHEGYDRPQQGIDEDTHHEDTRRRKKHHSRKQEVSLAHVPLLSYLESEQPFHPEWSRFNFCFLRIH
jgi:hypothetical protein